MLPRPRFVCQEPSLRQVGRMPSVPDKISRGLCSISRYTAQILICFIAFIFQFLNSSVGLVAKLAGLPPCTMSCAFVIRMRRFCSFVVAGSTASCHYESLRCHHWCWGCQYDDLLSLLSINIIFTPVLLWYQYRWNVYDIFVCLFYHASMNLSTILLQNFLFSNWKQGIVDMTALSSLVAPWIVITATWGAIGGAWVVGFTTFGFQCSISIIFTPVQRWFLHHWNVYDACVFCFYYVWITSPLLHIWFWNWKQGIINLVYHYLHIIVSQYAGHRGVYIPWAYNDNLVHLKTLTWISTCVSQHIDLMLAFIPVRIPITAFDGATTMHNYHVYTIPGRPTWS